MDIIVDNIRCNYHTIPSIHNTCTFVTMHTSNQTFTFILLYSQFHPFTTTHSNLVYYSHCDRNSLTHHFIHSLLCFIILSDSSTRIHSQAKLARFLISSFPWPRILIYSSYHSVSLLFFLSLSSITALRFSIWALGVQNLYIRFLLLPVHYHHQWHKCEGNILSLIWTSMMGAFWIIQYHLMRI